MRLFFRTVAAGGRATFPAAVESGMIFICLKSPLPLLWRMIRLICRVFGGRENGRRQDCQSEFCLLQFSVIT